jgi:hypothetical protein
MIARVPKCCWLQRRFATARSRIAVAEGYAGRCIDLNYCSIYPRDCTLSLRVRPLGYIWVPRSTFDSIPVNWESISPDTRGLGNPWSIKTLCCSAWQNRAYGVLEIYIGLYRPWCVYGAQITHHSINKVLYCMRFTRTIFIMLSDRKIVKMIWKISYLKL